MPQDHTSKGLSDPSPVQCQDLFMNAPIGVFTSTPEGRFLSANPAMARMLGYDSPEELMESVTDIPSQMYAAPSEREEIKRLLRENGEVFNYECRALRRDGNMVWTSRNAREVRDEDGNVVHYQGFITDITDRKQAEAGLLHQKAHFESIFTNTNDAMALFDTEHCIVNVNGMFTNMFGYALDEVLGKNINTVVDPHKQVHEYGSPRILQGEQIEMDAVRYTRSGEPRNVLLKGGPVREQDEIVGGYAIYADITDRKKAEEALFESKKKLDIFFSQSFSGFFFMMLDEPVTWHEATKDEKEALLDYAMNHQRMTRVNQAMLDQYGAKAEDFIGLTFVDLCAHDLEHGRNILRELFEQGRWHVENREQRLDGTPIIIDGDFICLYDSQGRVTGHFGVQHDITDRKLAEENLRQSKNYYRTIFETSGTAMFLIEEDTTIRHVNCNFETLSGYSRKEIQGEKSWTEFVHPDDLAWMKKNHYLRRQDPDAAPRQYEFRFINRYGQEFNALLAVDIIPGTSHSIGSAIDITQRKRVEEELHESKNLLNSVFQSIQDGISVLNADLTIRKVNQTMEKWYAHAAPLPGKKCHQVYQNRSEPCVSCPSIKALEKKTACSEVVPLMKEGNQSGWLELYSYPLIDERTESVSGIVEFVRDITERKHYEEQLRYLSMHDQLTSLFNRAYFENELKRFKKSREHPIAIICMDVDGLKMVNDMFGHEQGDVILKQSAEILKEVFRGSDILARTGGDEFTALLPKTDIQAGKEVIQRIKSRVKMYNREKDETQIPLSISVGLSAAEDADRDLLVVFKEADDLMYRDKLNKDTTARSQLMRTILAALKERDFFTHGNSRRMEDLCHRLGQRAGLSEKQLSDLALLAQLHDLGKIGIPDHILFKEAPLTDEEWEIMYKHPEQGYRIAMSGTDLAEIADLILKHHEQWNGEGYPLGLEGEEIPIECRILAIADAYDAMTSDRPYRKAMSPEEANAELNRCAGTQFDPELVEMFISILEDPDGV